MPSIINSLTWDQITARKVAERDALFPSEWLLPTSSDLSRSVKEGGAIDVTSIPAQSGILTPVELEITETEGSALVDMLAKGELTSVDVVTAFAKRATIAHQLTNCLTEINFSAALSAAAALDAHLASTGKPLGPLHGLPVSLKDNFEVHGLDTTVGFVGWTNDPCVADEHADGEEEVPRRSESEMTKILRQSGAVLFCKTNVPTAMMIAESYNNVWGYTLNPFNRHLSSGGSSGGESALLAMKGSPLGVGTDIGGSIRIPASFCNLYALKPSHGRFSTTGARSGLPGQESVLSINGPMSSSLSTISLWAKSVVESEWWVNDPKVLPIPWREIQLPKKLAIGIVFDDGVVSPTPPIQRGLRLVAEALTLAGHEVIPFTPYSVTEGGDLLRTFFHADGANAIRRFLSLTGEPWPQGLTAYKQLEKGLSASELWEVHNRRNGYVKGANAHWNSVETETGRVLDAVISPCSPYPGCLHHTFEYVNYTGIWNITDQPSVVFPVTHADPSLDPIDTTYQPRSSLDESVWRSYDPVKQANGPVALQLIGRRLHEEQTLAMTEVVASALAAARK